MQAGWGTALCCGSPRVSLLNPGTGGTQEQSNGGGAANPVLLALNSQLPHVSMPSVAAELQPVVSWRAAVKENAASSIFIRGVIPYPWTLNLGMVFD